MARRGDRSNIIGKRRANVICGYGFAYDIRRKHNYKYNCGGIFKVDKILDQFKNPDSEYRTAPFWSWNGDMSADEIEFQMKEFKSHGIGGGFAHPRVGMITEYLSEDYFKAWRSALEVARREDMKLYMYDENAWPSGFAGGIVAETDPSTIGSLAKYEIIAADHEKIDREILFAAEYKGDALGKTLTDIPQSEWSAAASSGQIFVLYRIMPNEDRDCDWTGGHPYTDVTNPKTIELFLKCTYDEHFKRFGDDFGSLVPAVFSDEANINSEGTKTVPFTEHVEKKFYELNGYHLRKNLPAIFKNIEGDFDRPAEKVRYDYFYTLHELWINSFVKPIAEWCEKHNIAWTGHEVEHQWPQSHGGRISVTEQTTYEFRQWPGLDLLLCDHLRNEPTNFDKFEMMEVRSSANQFGHKRTLCEAYGAGGYHSTLDDYKRLGDYLMVNGINFICQHLSLYSYAGSRKRDCPQSFDYRQPWWNEYTTLADYFARLGYITSSGKMEQRILLVNASTTGYLTPPEEAIGMVDHITDPKAIKNPDMSDFLEIVSRLADEQWDFDIGDEYSMERHAKCDGKKLVFGKQTYDIVIVSRNMLNLRRETANILLDFIKNGGTVLVTGNSGETEGGYAGEYISGLTAQPESELLTSKWQYVGSPDDLMRRLSSELNCYVSSSRAFPTGFAHIRRALPDGRTAYFFVNHAMETYKADITLCGKSCEEWDLFTGETHTVDFKHENGKISFPLSLERCESILIIVNNEDGVSAKSRPDYTKTIDLELVDITRESSNILTLDHPSLTIDGETYPPVFFLQCTDNLFRHRGFEKDPWSVIQPKTDFMDRNAEYKDGSGFSVDYTFYKRPGFKPSSVVAVIERPTLMKFKINGCPIEWNGEKDILDPDTGVFDITSKLVDGENVITLYTDRFNVLDEIEDVYLRGSFSVIRENNRFVMAEEKPLGYGNWLDYGIPFYSGAVVYKYKTVLENDVTAAEIRLPSCYEATAVSLTINGKYVGLIGRNGGRKLAFGDLLKAGENTVEIRVAGSLRNQLGPHLGYNIYIPYDWSFYKKDHVATADEYEFSNYGLTGTPVIKAAE